MKLSIKAISVFALVFALNSSVNAAMVKVDWLGTVTHSGVKKAVKRGNVITGSFIYDDLSRAIISTRKFSSYKTKHVSEFSVNGLSGSMNKQGISVFNNIRGIGDAFVSSRDGRRAKYTGDLFGGFSVSNIFVNLTDSNRKALSNTALPSFLDPTDFNFKGLSRIDFKGTNKHINFGVRSFSVSPVTTTVPEPPMLLLLGVTFLGLLGRKCKSV
ncbi:MAG: PEP-CTERM sorting domain-containing protein [Gammaproteobacteria bacterium]